MASLAQTSDQKEEKRTAAGEALPLFWMVKPCDIYKEEYKDCKCWKERFNQYYIYGEKQDCSQWKNDYDNCTLWKNKKDLEALKNVINSEHDRARVRLRNHYNNDIWENREKPPENWSSELPLSISDSYKNSYLHIKNEEEKVQEKQDEKAPRTYNTSSCIIM